MTWLYHQIYPELDPPPVLTHLLQVLSPSWLMSVSSAREPGRDTECCEVYWQEQCHLQKPVSQ